MLVCGEREAVVMAPPPMQDSVVSPCFHGCLAFLHRPFPPWCPSSHPLNPSLHSQHQPWHCDCSTIPKLQLPAAAPSRRPMFLPGICMTAARTIWLSFHLGWQVSCFTLSLKCFSSYTDNCPAVGIRPLLQFPHPLRVGPVLLILLLFILVPLSYRVFFYQSIYSFPLVRSPCLLSVGVLHALLCLNVYFWCIPGKRCTPCPPTLPSCSPSDVEF